MRRIPVSAAAVVAAFFALLSAAGAQNLTNCSTASQNRYVLDVMRDIYYWYKELPVTDAAASRRPRPTSTPCATGRSTALQLHRLAGGRRRLLLGQPVHRLRPRLQLRRALGLRLTRCSPKARRPRAGMDRGIHYRRQRPSRRRPRPRRRDRDAFGPAGRLHIRSLERAEAAPSDATIAKRAGDDPDRVETAVSRGHGGKSGYVFFRNFVSRRSKALDSAFALQDAGATELVLDLRYNGGGLVSVAQHLAGLIGGDAHRGQVFARVLPQRRNESATDADRFESKAQRAVGLPRLVVITTRGSASASELVINALRPFIPVKVVGETDLRQARRPVRHRLLRQGAYPVSFSSRNARGQGDYFAGIPADCAAADDVGPPARRLREASLAEALTVVRRASARRPPSVQRRSGGARPRSWTRYRRGMASSN